MSLKAFTKSLTYTLTHLEVRQLPEAAFRQGRTILHRKRYHLLYGQDHSRSLEA